MGARSRGGARAVGLVALGVGLVVLMAILWSRRGGDTDVVVIGDSVAHLSRGPIEAALDGDVKVIAQPGYTSADLFPLAEKAVAALGDATGSVDALILVGYNDVIQSGPGADGLDALIELSTRFRCAVWLTLPTTSPGNDGALDADAAAAWNERLRGLVASHPSLQLATAWAEAVDASGPGELVVDDGLHPTTAGQQRLAAVMSSARDAACASAG